MIVCAVCCCVALVYTLIHSCKKKKLLFLFIPLIYIFLFLFFKLVLINQVERSVTPACPSLVYMLFDKGSIRRD